MGLECPHFLLSGGNNEYQLASYKGQLVLDCVLHLLLWWFRHCNYSVFPFTYIRFIGRPAMRHLVNFFDIEWTITGSEPRIPFKIRLPTEFLMVVDTMMGSDLVEFLAENGKDIILKNFGWEVKAYTVDVVELLHTASDMRRKILQSDNIYINAHTAKTFIVDKVELIEVMRTLEEAKIKSEIQRQSGDSVLWDG